MVSDRLVVDLRDNGLSKQLQMDPKLIPNTDESEVAFLGSVTADTGSSPWMSEIKVDNYDVVFKIDTGADVSAVPETLYTQGQFSRLEKAKLILNGPGRTPLKVKGMFTATLRKRNKNHNRRHLCCGMS